MESFFSTFSVWPNIRSTAVVSYVWTSSLLLSDFLKICVYDAFPFWPPLALTGLLSRLFHQALFLPDFCTFFFHSFDWSLRPPWVYVQCLTVANFCMTLALSACIFHVHYNVSCLWIRIMCIMLTLKNCFSCSHWHFYFSHIGLFLMFRGLRVASTIKLCLWRRYRRRSV